MHAAVVVIEAKHGGVLRRHGGEGHHTFRRPTKCIVRKMGLILRSIERRLKIQNHTILYGPQVYAPAVTQI
jgi:hypothetical protein